MRGERVASTLDKPHSVPHSVYFMSIMRTSWALMKWYGLRMKKAEKKSSKLDKLPAALAVRARKLADDKWLEGASFAELGRDLAIGEDDARRVLRAAIAVLRREFGAG